MEDRSETGGAGTIGTDAEESYPEGFQVGSYRIVRKLGDGGMGVVYLARQTEPIERLVTIKFVRPEAASDDVVQRFDVERRNLARMTHPNISTIFEAGNLDDGTPYFVMEYVQGVSLSRYCFDNRLDIKSRIRLMVDICHAVQHAHQKGIIHRDLKPANILVSTVGDQVAPKVIDFGIACLMTSDPDDSEVQAALNLVGTPQYMSPEHFGWYETDIDARVDVYSLGILLYELLCGGVPPELMLSSQVGIPAEKGKAALAPSTFVRKDDIDVSAERQVSGKAQLARLLEGDLDAIILKAIAFHRRDRYQTVHALADDLQRYLAGQIISLRKTDSLYALGKALSRHRFLTVTIAAATTVLSILVVVLMLQVRATEQARMLAQLESEQRLALQELITASFTSGSPESGIGYQLTAREVLETMADNIDALEVDDGEARTALLLEAARFFYEVSQFDAAERSARRALSITRKTHDPLLRARCMTVLAEILNYKGEFEEAGRLLSESLALLEGAGLHYSATHLLATILFAELKNLVGNHHEAMVLAADAVHQIESATTRNDKLLARAMFALAESHVHSGDWENAIDTYDRAYRASQLGYGPDAGITHDIYSGLAYAWGMNGNLAKEESMWREELEYSAKTFGPEHQKTIATLANLGSNLQAQERWEEALEFQSRAYAGMLKFNAEDHPDTLTVKMNIASIQAQLGNFEVAKRQHMQVIETRTRIYGSGNVFTAYAEQAFGETLLLASDYADAAVHLESALQILDVSLGEHWRTAQSHIRLGQALLGLERYDAAEAEFEQGFRMARATLKKSHPRLLAWSRDVADQYASQAMLQMPPWLAPGANPDADSTTATIP